MNTINWMDEVEKRKDQLLEDLNGLLRIPSTKDLTTSTTEAPMGQAIGEALRYMIDIGERDGFITNTIDGYAGIIDYGDSDDYIGVLSHIDVVPATGKWTTPPFEPTIRNGKIYARGTIDDKGPTLAAYYALRILKDMGVSVKTRIRLIIGTDEESGMSCMTYYFNHESMPKFGFSPDADFPIIHAEKGQINIKLGIGSTPNQSGSDLNQLKSFHAGERPNMVPGEAEAKLVVPLSYVEGFIHDFKTYLDEHHLKGNYQVHDTDIHLYLEGKAVHGMEPNKGINAGTELAHFLATKLDGSGLDYMKWIDDYLYQDHYGVKLGVNVTDDILGPLTVNPGIMSYHDDKGGELSLNIRCPLATDYDATKKTLTNAANDSDWKVIDYRQKAPHHVEKDHPMIKTMQHVYQKQTGDEPTLLSTGGGTYARFMEQGVAFGACFPGKEMTAHQVDEYIEIDDLLKATAIYAETLYQLSEL